MVIALPVCALMLPARTRTELNKIAKPADSLAMVPPAENAASLRAAGFRPLQCHWLRRSLWIDAAIHHILRWRIDRIGKIFQHHVHACIEETNRFGNPH